MKHKASKIRNSINTPHPRPARWFAFDPTIQSRETVAYNEKCQNQPHSMKRKCGKIRSGGSRQVPVASIFLCVAARSPG